MEDPFFAEAEKASRVLRKEFKSHSKKLSMVSPWVELLFGAIRFGASLILAVSSIYFGVKAFDKLTQGIEEIEELKKGNVAVGLFIATIIISIALVVSIAVGEVAKDISTSYPILLIIPLVVIDLRKLLFSLILALLMIYVSLTLLDKLTRDIDEIAELKRGNIGIAILIAGVIIAVAAIVGVGLESLISSDLVSSCKIAAKLGLDASACLPA